MKYWLLTTEYPPQYGGGIGTYVFYTARMLHDKGHEVTVFLHDRSLAADVVSEEGGIRLVRFVANKTGTHRFLGFQASISYEYAHVVGEYIKLEGQPDIIESQEYEGIAYYLQQFKSLNYEYYSGLNIMITCHSPSFLCLEYNHVPIYQFPYYWTGHMEKSCIRSADLLISPSRYFVQQSKGRMNWEGLNEKYVPNPIETNGDGSVPAYRENYIVCFGKLSPLKGTFELLQYFKRLWDNGFQYPLHIVGGTQQVFHPEGSTMEAIVKKKYGIYLAKNLLRLEGELEPGKAREKMKDAHVVLVPSVVDNLPYTVLEAMSWGKVVLASCQGGQQEIIRDGENGFLFDHDIVDDFRDKLLEVLKLDNTAIRKIGENAIRTIQSSYSPDTIYHRKMEVITSFLQQKRMRRDYPFVWSNGNPSLPSAASNGELLSIVIPYYNMGDYVEESIRSVLASDYIHKEIILVNDGSTDERSKVILEELERKYPVKVFNKENEGLPLTRNYGAWKASGKYLAFLDADDTVEKTYYSKAIQTLGMYDNVHFVGCWTRYFGMSNACWPTFNPEPPYLLVHNMVNSSALVYKKDSFLRHGLNDPDLLYGMEDWDSVINMVKKNYCGVVLPELLFNYRVRKDSMARSFTRIKQLHLYRVIGERHKDIYNKFGNEIAQLLNANGSGIGFDNPTQEPPAKIFPAIHLPGFLKERIKHKVKHNKYLRNFAYKLYQQLIN